jgi:hypothetical protein
MTRKHGKTVGWAIAMAVSLFIIMHDQPAGGRVTKLEHFHGVIGGSREPEDPRFSKLSGRPWMLCMPMTSILPRRGRCETLLGPTVSGLVASRRKPSWVTRQKSRSLRRSAENHNRTIGVFVAADNQRICDRDTLAAAVDGEVEVEGRVLASTAACLLLEDPAKLRDILEGNGVLRGVKPESGVAEDQVRRHRTAGRAGRHRGCAEPLHGPRGR